MSDFPRQRRCTPCEGGTAPLDAGSIHKRLQRIHSRWQLQGLAISAELQFDDYWQASAFTQAVAWIAHRENHHPDITLGYKRVSITYTTHAIGGLSENDFICAAMVDALLD